MRSAFGEGAGESKEKLPSPDIVIETLPYIVHHSAAAGE
jgi:hypothetical protein